MDMELKQTTSTLGSSLEVPYVQDLAKQSLTTVPSRYVRPDQHPLFISNTSSSSATQVPVIDMDKLLSQEFMGSELDKLHNASKEWGFFQVINHGVSVTVVDKLKLEAQNFFNLPTDEKKKFCQQGDIEGYGQAFVVSEEQKLDWCDMMCMTTLPTHMRKPYLFPNLPLPLKHILKTYSKEIENLAMKLMSLMAKALKIESSELRGIFEEGWQSLRMNYYPPCPQPELVVGLTPHSDAGGLTILLQANETQGLQIKKDGNWVCVQCLPNAFVVNIGDILEVVTNGIYRSIEHRATVNLEKDRLSIATFCCPRMDAEIGPSPSIITPENQPLFKRIGYADYIKGFFARELDGKSYIDVLRIHKK